MHATGLVRKGFYPNYHASYVSVAYCLGVSLLLVAVSLLFLWTYHKKILKR